MGTVFQLADHLRYLKWIVLQIGVHCNAIPPPGMVKSGLQGVTLSSVLPESNPFDIRIFLMKLFNHLPGIVCRPIIYKNHFILSPGQSLCNTARKLCKRLLFIQKWNNHTYEMRILYIGFANRSGADCKDFWSFKQLSRSSFISIKIIIDLMGMKKLYCSIGEVSELRGVESHVLRYWETFFSGLNPRKNKGGNRTYREQDITLILQLKELLQEKKYSTAGAKKYLEEGIEGEEHLTDSEPLPFEVQKDLKEIRVFLTDLLERL